jgi:hypothetical protein
MHHRARSLLRSASPLGRAVRPLAASVRLGSLAVSSVHRLACSELCATFFRGRPATALNRLSFAKKKASLCVAVPVSKLGFGSARGAVAFGHQPNWSVEGTSNSGLHCYASARSVTLLAAPHLQR